MLEEEEEEGEENEEEEDFLFSRCSSSRSSPLRYTRSARQECVARVPNVSVHFRKLTPPDLEILVLVFNY
ncbi:hypothetical protein E2C01_073010 [Portunus trituberculatus]|uniref:Uncharacterized protein n=1 Tax=Portunus trituberculatus TaxID=210409 RepID=A0A5B7I435_PORTR|nr:hypothetical protein [Portunus trituberculatus]